MVLYGKHDILQTISKSAVLSLFQGSYRKSVKTELQGQFHGESVCFSEKCKGNLYNVTSVETGTRQYLPLSWRVIWWAATMEGNADLRWIRIKFSPKHMHWDIETYGIPK